VHCHGDQITNSLAEEAKGGRVDVELSTMGLGDCLFHIFSVILICSLRTYAARALAVHTSFIRRRKECPQHKYNKGHIKIIVLEVRHSAHFDALRRFFKVNYVARALVPLRAMTGLVANGIICPKNPVQKVSIFDMSYLSQKWWRPCQEAKGMYLQLPRNMWLCDDTGSRIIIKKLRAILGFTR
jgi:hypothetical protein